MGYRPPAVTDFEMRSERWSMEQRSAAYHRAGAARARRLGAEATTPWLKEHLENAIAQHEQIAAEIERASEPDGDAMSSQDETSALSSETPGRQSGGSTRSPFGTTGRSGLSAGDYSSPRLHWTTFDLWLMLMGSPQAQSLSQLTGTRVNPCGEARVQALPGQGEGRPARLRC